MIPTESSFRKQSFYNAASKTKDDTKVYNNGVIVVNTSVSLACKIPQVPNIRIVGVWIGLDQVSEFEKQTQMELQQQQKSNTDDDDGDDDDATYDSVVWARIKDIV